MDATEDVNKDMDVKKLAFIGSIREKLNFNNFLSSISNGQFTLKEREFLQKYLCSKINELKFKYKPKPVKEKEEIDRVLMQANDMLKYRGKIIEAFRDGTFSSEHRKHQMMLFMIMC